MICVRISLRMSDMAGGNNFLFSILTIGENMLQYYCWHDNGLATMVSAINEGIAKILACRLWNEPDFTKVTVELRQ